MNAWQDLPPAHLTMGSRASVLQVSSHPQPNNAVQPSTCSRWHTGPSSAPKSAVNSTDMADEPVSWVMAALLPAIAGIKLGRLLHSHASSGAPHRSSAKASALADRAFASHVNGHGKVPLLRRRNVLLVGCTVSEADATRLKQGRHDVRSQQCKSSSWQAGSACRRRTAW